MSPHAIAAPPAPLVHICSYPHPLLYQLLRALVACELMQFLSVLLPHSPWFINNLPLPPCVSPFPLTLRSSALPSYPPSHCPSNSLSHSDSLSYSPSCSHFYPHSHSPAYPPLHSPCNYQDPCPTHIPQCPRPPARCCPHLPTPCLCH